MMEAYWPWVALMLGGFLILFRDWPKENLDKRKIRFPSSLWGLVLVAILIPIVARLGADFLGELRFGLYGLAVGLLLSCILFAVDQFGQETMPSRGAVFAIIAAFVGFATLWGGENFAQLLLGGCLGLGAASIWLERVAEGEAKASSWSLIGAAFSLPFVAAHLVKGDNKTLVPALILLGMVLAASIGASRAVPQGQTNSKILPALVFAGLFILGVWGVALKIAESRELGIVATGSTLCALAVSWMLPESQKGSHFRFLLAMSVWLGIATFAFAIWKSPGLAIAAICGVGVFLGLGNRNALVSMAPLMALLLYRVLRSLHPGESRAFDIGQHYALIGLIIGLLIVLATLEWSASQKHFWQPKGQAALLFMGLNVLVLAGAALLLTGALGASGLLIGLGLAPAIAAFNMSRYLESFVIPVGTGSAVLLAYGPFSENLDLTREQKVQWLWPIAVILIVFSLFVWLLSERGSPTQTEVVS